MSADTVTINGETGEILARGPVDLDAESARDLTDRIKVAIEGSWLLVKQAYESERTHHRPPPRSSARQRQRGHGATTKGNTP